MHTKPKTFTELIEKWGLALFAADIGVPYPTANAMKQRRSVSNEYWPAIIASAPKRGLAVSFEDLSAMWVAERARRKAERRNSGEAAA